MPEISVRAENRIGLVTVAGALNDAAIPRLKDAFAEAVSLAETPRVLIIEDAITATSHNAALIIVAEGTTLKTRSGDIKLVSTDGNIGTPGRPSSLGLFVTAFTSLDLAFALFDTISGP
jgi:hypothetical protein